MVGINADGLRSTVRQNLIAMESAKGAHAVIAACPVCDGPAYLMAEHPEAFIHRCPNCTHCFSVLKEAAGLEPYDERYYDDEHRRWFENPNIKLFERIAEGTLAN